MGRTCGRTGCWRRWKWRCCCLISHSRACVCVCVRVCVSVCVCVLFVSQVVAGVEYFQLLAATVVIVADLLAAGCIVRILRDFTFSTSARKQDRDAVESVPETDLVFVDTPKKSFLSSFGSCHRGSACELKLPASARDMFDNHCLCCSLAVDPSKAAKSLEAFVLLNPLTVLTVGVSCLACIGDFLAMIFKVAPNCLTMSPSPVLCRLSRVQCFCTRLWQVLLCWRCRHRGRVQVAAGRWSPRTHPVSVSLLRHIAR